ncbi:protocadherin-9-like isoform X2 [Lethenteron reissneri]|uniref:protocadherin-9-like isoform X2 n=1 Tax=Lethenteron reissneri TaxID=7753 RepID=UPI002AB61C9D|nr:protocadherin-9-like isoform X2 [Lethenteron reissneri]
MLQLRFGKSTILPRWAGTESGDQQPVMASGCGAWAARPGWLPPPLLVPLLLLLLLSRLSSAEEFKVSYRVAEELREGAFIGNPSVDLRLADYNLELTYKVMLSKAEDAAPPLVRVNPRTGELFAAGRKMDREALCGGQDPGDECHVDVQVGVLPVLPGPFFKLIEVRINVEDINDNAPAFAAPVLTVSVPENAPAGKRFPIQPANDPDSEANGVRRYELLPSDPATVSTFELSVTETADGEKVPYLVVRKSLDREERQLYEMNLRAVDGGSPPHSGSAVLRINVTDTNDNSPVFDQAEVNVEIPENSPVGTHVVQLHASDRDAGSNAEVVYRLGTSTSGAGSGQGGKRLFRLDQNSGLVTVNGLLNREESPVYRIIILATDKGPEPVPATATVTVTVTDVNDNSPTIEIRDIVAPVNGVIYISEASHVNLPVALITVSDPDIGANGAVTCYIYNPEVPFQLKKLTYPNQYLLETRETLDYETKNEYVVQIKAADAGATSLSRTMSVTIKLLDSNDNAPVFTEPTYKVSVPENNVIGKHLITVSATDRDMDKNAEMVYFLGPDAPTMFHMDPETGIISLTEQLDREKKSNYSFTILAKDQGIPVLEGNATVIVNVLDVNDNRPRFSLAEFDFYVNENVPKHSTVGMVTVADSDEGENGRVRLSILGTDNRQLFSIDPESGMIRSNVGFDREQRHYYVLEVQATDGGEPVRSSTVKVVIHVMDINDNSPIVLMPPSNTTYKFVVPRTLPGTIVTEVSAVDNDAEINAELRYHIVGGNPHNLFHIDPVIGNITLMEPLTETHHGLHRLVVRVSDIGIAVQHHAVALVHVFVNETLENATYIEWLIAGSLQTPLDTDVAGFGRREQEDNKVLLLAAVLAGVLGVALIVLLGVLVHRCYCNRRKGGGGGIVRAKHGGQEWLSPTQEKKHSNGGKNNKKSDNRKKKKHANGAPFSIAIEASKNSEDPTYQTINEAMSWGHESDAPSPIYGLGGGGGGGDGVATTFKPGSSSGTVGGGGSGGGGGGGGGSNGGGGGGSESPDLARHYRSTSPVTPVSLPQATQQTPTAGKKYGVIQELPVANTFVGSGGSGVGGVGGAGNGACAGGGNGGNDCMSSKRSSISSEHYSHSETECSSQSGGNNSSGGGGGGGGGCGGGGGGNNKGGGQRYNRQPQRRVKFTLDGECYGSSQQSCADSGLGDTSDGGPPLGPAMAYRPGGITGAAMELGSGPAGSGGGAEHGPGLPGGGGGCCYYQLTPLTDEGHERSTPDGSIGEIEHLEHGSLGDWRAGMLQLHSPNASQGPA